MNRTRLTALIIGGLLLVGGGSAVGATGDRTRDMGGMTHCIGGGGAIDMLAVASEYLELTEDEVWERRVAGESLADIARAEGKTVEGLVDALVAAHAEWLQALVDDGTITEAQRDARLVRIEARMWIMVERVMGHGGGHHGGGPLGMAYGV